MLLQLFEHNEKAYRAAVQMMEECGKAAIVHPTGTGKSYIAFKLIEEHPVDTIFWLSPSEYIFKTQIENLKRQTPDISLANVHFYTYAKLMCCATEELEAIAGLNPAYIILDEAQNTTPAQMKMFLTRIGFGSKAIITGDLSQKDLPFETRSGLEVALTVIKNIEEISVCHLTSLDVVRHPLVQKIVEAYDAYEKKDADASRVFRRNNSGTRDRKDGGRKNR